jgi:hypothetical protein
MKKLFPIAIACLFALGTQAQNGTPPSPSSPLNQSQPKQEQVKKEPAQPAPAPDGPAPVLIESAGQSTPPSLHDGVMMSGGKMWVAKGGTTIIMTKEVTLDNGTKVATDGTCTTKDGKKLTLKNGEVMTKDGKIVKADAVKAADPKANGTNPAPAK